MKKKEVNTDMTLVGHLAELRKRIILSGIALIVAAIIGYNFAGIIIKDMIARAPNLEFVFIAPSELMLSYIRIAIYFGLAVSAPIILSQIWIFVSPGLEDGQRKYIKISFFIGFLLFLVGVVFSYIYVLPTVYNFFAGYKVEGIQSAISFGNYLGFSVSILASFGLVFELPVVMYVLTRFGIIKVNFFIKYRKHMILVILFVAAVLTPPDVVSQVMLAIPMLLLYEIGIVMSKLGAKKRIK